MFFNLILKWLKFDSYDHGRTCAKHDNWINVNCTTSKVIKSNDQPKMGDININCVCGTG